VTSASSTFSLTSLLIDDPLSLESPTNVTGILEVPQGAGELATLRPDAFTSACGAAWRFNGAPLAAAPEVDNTCSYSTISFTGHLHVTSALTIVNSIQVGGIIYVGPGGRLVIENGAIVEAVESSQLLIIVDQGGTLHLRGGTIRGNLINYGNTTIGG